MMAENIALSEASYIYKFDCDKILRIHHNNVYVFVFCGKRKYRSTDVGIKKRLATERLNEGKLKSSQPSLQPT